MAGTSFTFTAYGTKEIGWMVADLQRRGEDTYTLNLAIAQRGLAQTQHRIRVEQRSPEGVPWTPSKAALKRADPKRPTLVDTQHFVGATFSAEATRNEAIWGTSFVAGRIFQEGGTIKREARQGTVRLRQNADGSLMRQGSEGRLARLARFAKASHKRAKEVSFHASAYSIRIIARPYLGLSEANWQEMIGLVEDHYLEGLQGTA